MTSANFTINGWLVETDLGRLTRKSKAIRLEPQVMKVLAYLANHPMKVVTKDELIRAVWHNAIVGDAAVARCISQIRQAFGDSARNPRYVETIPKVGYRWIARDEERPGPAARNPLARWSAAAMLAVAFMVVSNSQPNQPAEASAGINAESAAASAYRKGRDMYSRYTYEGNQNAIVLFQQAIRAEKDFGLAYAGIADALAQQHLYWDGERLDTAHEYAVKALELIPTSPESHKALGIVLLLQGDKAAAIDSYRTALELDPTHWPAAYDLGRVYYNQLDYDRAEELFLQALDHAPEHDAAMSSLGFLYYRSGEVDAARTWFNKVLDKVPLHAQAASQLAMLEMTTGQSGSAADRCSLINRVFPEHYLCLQIQAVSSLMAGDYALAYERFANVIEKHPDDRYARLGQAKTLLAQSRDAEGLLLVEEVYASTLDIVNGGEPKSYDYWLMAAAHVLRGETADAWQWFDRTAEAGRRLPLWDANDPILQTARGDHRFNEYLAATSVHF
jgi:DNA-binding winged helix-turn-helix (wHTH) protein/Tfp pilus assembly protein PilF